MEPSLFLKACGLCNCRLTPDRDIFMYRGDTSFCSEECREQIMKHDERKENSNQKPVKTGRTTTSKSSGNGGELKAAVEWAMRDTYFTMEEIEVTKIVQMEEQEDDELLFGCIESGSEISVREYGLNLDVDLKYEGGANNWAVRCKCGAEDDDGERMVACDICEIWQHTLCGGIDDSEDVPVLFICETCCTSLAPQRSQQCVLDF